MTYHASVVLRTLRPDDLPALMELKAAAGWNQTDEDWLRLMAMQPEGCLGIEMDGRIVASATTVCYGADLAWIGMVLTLPQYRGRGFARRLMREAVSVAGTRAVRLDASEQGRPLYESMGFVAECPVERWQRAAGPVSEAAPAMPLAFDAALDRAAFGADRSWLIRELARHEGASADSSYALGRPGSSAAFFGPCIAADSESARRLLHWFLARHAHESVVTDLFPLHQPAVRMASDFGFAPLRHLTRMVLSPAPVRVPDRRVFAIAGFEWG